MGINSLKLFLPIIIFIVLLFGVVGVASAITLDNSGGTWAEYMHFTFSSPASEYGQYKIVVNGTNWYVYTYDKNTTDEVLLYSVSYDGFWSKVKSDGSDIRVFDQEKQLYFWIEKWDYANKTAVIWVNLTAGSSELNIAYGNPSATKSNYENPEQVFEFFDDFSGDLSKWTLDTTYGSITIENGKMKIEDTSTSGSPSAKIVFATPIDYNIIVEWKWTLATNIANTYYQVYDDSGDGYGSQARLSTAHDDIASYDGSTYHTIMTGVSVNTEYKIRNVIKLDSQREDWYVNDELKLADDVFANPMNNVKEIVFQAVDSDKTGTVYIDDVKVFKLADPVDFETSSVKTFGATFYIVSKSPSETSITLYYRGEAIEQQFNISLNTYADNVYWYLDGSKIKTDTNVLNSSVTVTFTDVGTHKVDVVAVNGEYTATTYWNIEIVQLQVPISPVVDSTHLILWLRFDEGKEPIKDYSGHSYTISANSNFVTGRYGYGFDGPLSISISKPANYTIVYWLKENDGWHFYTFTNTAKYKDLKSGDYAEHFTWSTELSFDNVIIDDIKAYNATLSFEQIKQMYEALRVKFYDESSGEKIKANATIFNANHSINLQVDSITKEAVLFHADVPEYGEYYLTATANDYATRHRVIQLSNDSLTEVDVYLPKSSESIANVIVVNDIIGELTNYQNYIRLSVGNKTIEEQKLQYGSSPTELKAYVYLLKSKPYIITVYNEHESRCLGWIYPSLDGYIYLHVSQLNYSKIRGDLPVQYNVTSTNSTIKVWYKTIYGETTSAKVVITDRNGTVVFEQTLNTPEGVVTFLKNDSDEDYIVKLEIDNSVEKVKYSNLVLGSGLAIKLPQLDVGIEGYNLATLPAWMRATFFGGLCIFIALLFKKRFVPVGLTLSLALAVIFTNLGILELPNTLLTALFVLVGLAYFVWWRKREEAIGG